MFLLCNACMIPGHHKYTCMMYDAGYHKCRTCMMFGHNKYTCIMFSQMNIHV